MKLSIIIPVRNEEFLIKKIIDQLQSKLKIPSYEIIFINDFSTDNTVKITQDSTGYSVGIDTFKDGAGSAIPVYWPGGGTLPQVTQTASKTDIYSFMTFDGGSSLYGVVGGQNFA